MLSITDHFRKMTSHSPRPGLMARGMVIGLATVALLAGTMLAAAPAQADNDHGRGHWKHHHDQRWHRGYDGPRAYYYAPGYIYAPPPRPVYVVPEPYYYAPPPAPSLNIVVPLHIR